MSGTAHVTFVVAVNDAELFQNNFLASPCFRARRGDQVLIQEGFSSAAKAYNDAIRKSINDLIVFAHQDIIFPDGWLSHLDRALGYLEVRDSCWGVLGCMGMSPDGRALGLVYSSGQGIIGTSIAHPVAVQTLDEIVLILRRSSGLRFDEELPHFHLYGADICLTAAARTFKSYAIPAFCFHNTQQNFVLPREFYECYGRIRQVWKDYLPIRTTCINITRFGVPMYVRRLQEAYLRIRVRERGAIRTKDPGLLLQAVASLAQLSSLGSEEEKHAEL